MKLHDRLKSNFAADNLVEISKQDMDQALLHTDHALDKVEDSPHFENTIEDLKILLAMFKDYCNGIYREIPWRSITAIVFTVLFIVNPMDLIPDFIPMAGLLDDATIAGICLKIVQEDLYRYIAWKKALCFILSNR